MGDPGVLDPLSRRTGSRYYSSLAIFSVYSVQGIPSPHLYHTMCQGTMYCVNLCFRD